MLEGLNALGEIPDYELHHLTTRNPAFFDGTVRRHLETLEKEIGGLETQAGELERGNTELTGESVMKSD